MQSDPEFIGQKVDPPLLSSSFASERGKFLTLRVAPTPAPQEKRPWLDRARRLRAPLRTSRDWAGRELTKQRQKQGNTTAEHFTGD